MWHNHNKSIKTEVYLLENDQIDQIFYSSQEGPDSFLDTTTYIYENEELTSIHKIFYVNSEFISSQRVDYVYDDNLIIRTRYDSEDNITFIKETDIWYWESEQSLIYYDSIYFYGFGTSPDSISAKLIYAQEEPEVDRQIVTSAFEFFNESGQVTSALETVEHYSRNNDPVSIIDTNNPDIFISPNPMLSGNEFRINSSVPVAEIQIFNANGQLIKQEFHNNESNLTIQAPTSNGIYYIQIIPSDSNNPITKKILVIE